MELHVIEIQYFKLVDCIFFLIVDQQVCFVVDMQ